MEDHINKQIKRQYKFFKQLVKEHPENKTIKKEYLEIKKLYNQIKE